MECPCFRLECRLGLGLVEAVHGSCLHQCYQYCQAASHEREAIPHVLLLKENRNVEQSNDLITKRCQHQFEERVKVSGYPQRGPSGSFRVVQSHQEIARTIVS